MSRCSSIYKRRAEWHAFQREFVEQLLQGLTPHCYFPESAVPSWLLRQTSLSLPEDNRLRQWIVRPFMRKSHEPKDTQREYEQRYRPFRPELFKQQLSYYEKILRQAQHNNSHLLIVNMPLTAANVRLLPEGVYELYLRQVQTLAEKYHAQFLDFNDGKSFLDKDFSDQIHLNGPGAIKLMNRVANLVIDF